MLYEYLRVFKYDGLNMTDISLENQEEGINLDTGLGVGEYIYFAAYFPTNNFFYYANVANTIAANITVEYYNGNGWIPAVDVLDGTKVAGATFARSGVVQFEPNIREGWQEIRDTSEEKKVPELNNLHIYNCYWFRIKASVALDVATEAKTFSYAFTSDQMLDNLDIEVNKFLETYDTVNVKGDWIPEIMTASRLVMQYLKVNRLVIDKGQVLRFDDVSLATSWKTLELIYMNLGIAYVDNRKNARDEFTDAMSKRNFTFDTNQDAFTDRAEINNSIRGLSR